MTVNVTIQTKDTTNYNNMLFGLPKRLQYTLSEAPSQSHWGALSVTQPLTTTATQTLNLYRSFLHSIMYECLSVCLCVSKCESESHRGRANQLSSSINVFIYFISGIYTRERSDFIGCVIPVIYINGPKCILGILCKQSSINILSYIYIYILLFMLLLLIKRI